MPHHGSIDDSHAVDIQFSGEEGGGHYVLTDTCLGLLKS